MPGAVDTAFGSVDPRGQMPRLNLTQWLLVAAFLILYGAAVFAITRAYYLQQALARPVASQAPVPATVSGSTLGTSLQRLGEAGLTPREELTTDDPVLLARLGDQLFEQRQFERAVTAYRRALEFDPEEVDTYNDLGLALHYLGRSDEAVAALAQGIARRPDFQRIQLTMGFVQMHSGNPTAAAAALQRAVELGPETTVGAEAQRMLDGLKTP
jgi:tetratricopeptide (TPR) repeat protein